MICQNRERFIEEAKIVFAEMSFHSKVNWGPDDKQFYSKRKDSGFVADIEGF